MASKNNHSIIDYSDLSPAEVEKEMKHERMCAEMNDLVGNYLCSKFSGYPWGVSSDIRNGVVNFYLMIGHAGRAPFGITVKIDAQVQVMLKKCEYYAAELLERYGLRRGAMNADELEQLIETADFAGRIKIDES